MLLIHVLVVSAVLQWSVVTGEGRTDQLTLSLCRLWEECARTVSVDNMAPSELGSPEAICGDFVVMLLKHGVNCETLQNPGGETADVDLVLPRARQTEGQPEQEPQRTSYDKDETNDQQHDYRQHLEGNSNFPTDSNQLRGQKYPRNCSEIHSHVSGVYKIHIPHTDEPVSVYCDMNTDGGGWTVIQRRFNGSLEFFRSLAAYQDGFGDPSGEYWLGLDNIHFLTAHSPEMYVEMEDFIGNTKHSRYSEFSIGPGDYYNLHYKYKEGGERDAGDGFQTEGWPPKDLHGANFSCRGFNRVFGFNEDEPFTQAERYGGGWWFKNGYDSYSNLNGAYYQLVDIQMENNYWYGVLWLGFAEDWNYSLKKTKMMVRPSGFGARAAHKKLGRE